MQTARTGHLAEQELEASTHSHHSGDEPEVDKGQLSRDVVAEALPAEVTRFKLPKGQNSHFGDPHDVSSRVRAQTSHTHDIR